jgi:hypothetical protein
VAAEDLIMRVSRQDRLIRWKEAARLLGTTEDTLTSWAAFVSIPVVRTPHQFRQTYRSWVDAVLASARPGQDGDVAMATERWWSQRLHGREGVA